MTTLSACALRSGPDRRDSRHRAHRAVHGHARHQHRQRRRPPPSRSDLHASGAGLQLVLAGYTIAYAVLLITGARHRFADRLPAGVPARAAGVHRSPRRRAGWPRPPAQLVAFRFAQGVGAALMIPQVFSLIQRHFTGAARARALGWYAAVISGGWWPGRSSAASWSPPTCSAPAGGPIFLINVPIGVALLVLGRRQLPPGDLRRLAGRGGWTCPAWSCSRSGADVRGAAAVRVLVAAWRCRALLVVRIRGWCSGGPRRR